MPATISITHPLRIDPMQRSDGVYAVLIQTLLTCRYSLIISAPFSRPIPLAL